MSTIQEVVKRTHLQAQVRNLDNHHFDQFYPYSETIAKNVSCMWQVEMTVKLLDHLQHARNGNRERESKLINRLGQIRRCAGPFNTLSENLREAFTESVKWVQSTGRKVDFKHREPAMWITARDGVTPRW
jgi:hypothetical protein